MDTSQVTDMSRMFLNCSSLKELNLSSFNTNKVKDMSFMFGGCSALTNLNLKDFDTSQVTNMNGMFSNCDTLEELDLSDFDTTKVTNMSNIFENSNALRSLNLGDNFVVPDDQKKDLKLVDKTWVDVGTGTTNNPKPKEKDGVSSTDLMSDKNKGKWVAQPEQKYTGSFTVKIPNNIDDNLIVTVPKFLEPEYVGSTFSIQAPTKENYEADKTDITVKATETGLITDDVVTYTEITQPDVQAEAEPVDNEEKKVAEQPEIKPTGEISDFGKNIAIHPDVKLAKVYDSTGTLLEDHALSNNYSWLSEKKMELGDDQYYYVDNDEWVKAKDVYLYKDMKNVVKTKNVMMTGLVNSREEVVDNRALSALSDWDSDRVATISNHIYYRITNDEFVDSDNVDVVNE